MTEHRREKRRRGRFPVTVGRATLFTANVSGSGSCTEALRVLEPGTAVVGTIRVRGSEFDYAGRVVWARSGDPRLALRGRMGIEFVSIAPGFSSVLDTLPPVLSSTGA